MKERLKCENQKSINRAPFRVSAVIIWENNENKPKFSNFQEDDSCQIKSFRFNISRIVELSDGSD